jgi:non-heme chloroperoxidase
MSSEAWWSVMTLAAEAGYETIAFDRRSCGRSDDPGRGYDYDTWADDLAEIIEAVDLKDLTLVGHSMGCGEIARYLGRHGAARVARVVMAAPALPFMQKTADNPDGPNDPALIAEWHELWATRLTEWLAPALGAAYSAGAASERVAQTLRILLACPPWAAIRTNAAVVSTDFRPELARLAVPTLVLHGDADQSCPLEPTGAKLPALMPNCRLKVYPGATHALIGTHARELMADIAAFMREPALAAAE